MFIIFDSQSMVVNLKINKMLENNKLEIIFYILTHTHTDEPQFK